MMYGKEDYISRYAFIHVPKTGGAGIKRSLDKFLCRDYNNEHLPASYFDKHDHNHVFFTMIRDPYDRTCSEYFFIKRQLQDNVVDVSLWPQETKKQFSEILTYSIDYFLENFIEQNYNGSIYSHYFDSKNIKDFDFIGNISKMDESILIFNKMFNINIKKVKANINPNHQIGQPYNFKYSRNDFIKKHKKDYEIYEAGKEKFNKLKEKYL